MIFLERFFPHRARHKIINWLKAAIGAILVFLFFGYLFGFLPALLPLFPSAGLLLLSLLISIYLTEFYFRSFYGNLEPIRFEEMLLAEEVRGAADIIPIFLRSSFGFKVRERLGITEGMVAEFLNERRSRGVSLVSPVFSFSIISRDKEFQLFLSHFAITGGDLENVFSWIARDLEEEKSVEYWWTRESLGRIPGMAKNWGYGVTPTLDKFSRDLAETPLPSSDRLHFIFRKSLEQLETVLLRNEGRNALLVVDPNLSLLDIPLLFAAEVKAQRVMPALEGKRVLLLEQSVLSASKGSKTELEKSLITILNEAVRAGNVVLVIDNLSSFIDSVGSMGVDLVTLLDPYLGSRHLCFIATTGNKEYEGHLRKSNSLSRNFEPILVREPADEGLMEMLTDMSSHMRIKEKVFFTYPALKEIKKSAEAYFAENYTLDKTLDILSLLASRARAGNLEIIGKKEALNFIADKTGVPLGEISPSEKEMLLGLEELMHKRIVGQREAISFIAGALRRLRAGVRNPARPIGTFLFLGPTGVGKTETAKTLAEVYFGSEKSLMRLDMAEYQLQDSLGRLMERLSELLNKTPYGVLLLDEFEKASGDILNLFLSILDEGYFTDLDGKKVNARNIIFIATSNAASDIIFQAVEKGKDLASMKGKIVDGLVAGNIFRAELLNRFDGTVLFHPLGAAELKEIAKLLLMKFAARLREEKGIELTVDEYLITKVVTEGADRAFGARPMHRFIQEKIEELVAKKIIAGEISAGSHLKIDML